jgi:hypothetical protein
MNHYIIFTDTNTRQYIFQITDDGINIKSSTFSFTISKQSINLEDIQQLITKEEVLIVNDCSIFNTKHLVSVEYKIHNE